MTMAGPTGTVKRKDLSVCMNSVKTTVPCVPVARLLELNLNRTRRYGAVEERLATKLEAHSSNPT